jgi:Protein of unknown function (DUF2815)
MENIITSEVRLSFVHVFTPHSMEAGKDPKYSATLLFPHPSTLSGKALEDYNRCIGKLKEQAVAAAREKWGAELPKNLRTPFRDQGEKEYEGYVKGAVFLNVTSKQKPGVVDASVQDIIDPSQLYSGCYARVSVRAFAYDNKGNRGVAFGLQNVQKLRDGDPLSGKPTAHEDFEAVQVPIEVASAGSATDIFA